MNRKNVWDAISRSNSICPENILFLYGSQVMVNKRKFGMWRRRESQISNSFTRQNNNFARASLFFVHFFAVNYTTTREMPNFTFCEGRKQAMTKFILFMKLDMVDRNSAPEEFACIWQSKRVGIITIETEKNVNSLFHATFLWLYISRRGIF